MKWNTGDFGRKSQQHLMLATGLFPAALIVVLQFAPAALGSLCLLAVACWALALGCQALPGKRRLWIGILGALLVAALGAGLLPVKDQPALWLIPAAYGALLISGLQLSARNQELSPAVGILGVFTHGAAQFFLILAQRRAESYVGSAMTALTVCFLIFAVVTVLTLNRSSMEAAALNRSRAPWRMRRQNTVFTLCLLAVGILLALIPTIGSMVKTLWQWLITGIMKLAAFLMSLLPEEGISSAGSMSMGMSGLDMGEAGEPSWLSQMLEKVLTWLAVALLAAGLIWIMVKLSRKLWTLARYLWQRLSRFAAAAGEDYEDEVTDTREGGDKIRIWRDLGLRLTWADERRMTPGERVRYRYQRLKARHTEWRAASTARETLPQDAARVYEQVRYGGAEITPEDAEKFVRRIQEI